MGKLYGSFLLKICLTLWLKKAVSTKSYWEFKKLLNRINPENRLIYGIVSYFFDSPKYPKHIRLNNRTTVAGIMVL